MERMRATGLGAASGMHDSRTVGWRAQLMQLAVAVGVGLLVLPAAARAQGIDGVVVDSAGQPLRDAVVILVPGEARRTTDSRGRFAFGGLMPGRYVVRVRLMGFRPFERAVDVARGRRTTARLLLDRMPQLLGEVRIVDQDGCHGTSIEGFECRRSAGVGYYRDAAELRAINATFWADMFDGMPGVRRGMKLGPYGVDWQLEAPPGRCYVPLYNGQPEMKVDGETPFKPDAFWKPIDVVAIELYDDYEKVPAPYQAYAWPTMGQKCGLVIYWLRGAERRAPPAIRSPSNAFPLGGAPTQISSTLRRRP